MQLLTAHSALGDDMSSSYSAGTGRHSSNASTIIFVRAEASTCKNSSYEESSKELGFTTNRLHPTALILRLRVAQVVCGILATVMGVVACIEEKGEIKVGIGVVSGILTVLAAFLSIYVVFADPSPEAVVSILPQSVDKNRLKLLSVLYVFWTLAFAANFVTLVISFYVLASTLNYNLVVLGGLELLLAIAVIGLSAATLCLRRIYKDIVLS